MKVGTLLALTLSALIWSCATPQQCKDPTGEGKGQPPAILDAYAASVIRPGGTWRIHLIAKDADGDMKDIVAVLTQTGVAPYPTSFTPVRPEDSKELEGYLYLNTPVRDRGLIDDRLNLRVFVRDCQGNKSEAVEFPCRFDYGPPQEIPKRWKEMADHRLGAIMIDIEGSQPDRSL